MIVNRLCQSAPRQLRYAALAMALLCLGACSQPQGDAQAKAKRLISEVGCGSCHAIAGIDWADARVGPSLHAYGKRSYIAGLVPNNEDNLMKFLLAPQSVHPDTAMPDLDLTQQQARLISRYLHTTDGG